MQCDLLSATVTYWGQRARWIWKHVFKEQENCSCSEQHNRLMRRGVYKHKREPWTRHMGEGFQVVAWLPHWILIGVVVENLSVGSLRLWNEGVCFFNVSLLNLSFKFQIDFSLIDCVSFVRYTYISDVRTYVHTYLWRFIFDDNRLQSDF